MAAGSAAAVVGARIGSRIAKTGEARRRLVTAQDDVVDCFCNIFVHCSGSSQERLQRALMRVPQTTKGSHHQVNYPSKEDLVFMSKVADIDKNGEVSEQEACFAFRVWLCWQTLFPKISQMFENLDKDGNGTLDEDEILPYLIKLNDDEDVTLDEVLSVIERADANGDGSLDKAELVFATAVWYTDIDRKKLRRQQISGRVSAAGRHVSQWTSKQQGRLVFFLWGEPGSICICCKRRRRSAEPQPGQFRPSPPPGGRDSSSSTDTGEQFETEQFSMTKEASGDAVSSMSPSDAFDEVDKNGAGVGDLFDVEKARSEADNAGRISIQSDILEEKRKTRQHDVSIITDSTTATISPPCSKTGGPNSPAPSVTSSAGGLDQGYPEPPALLIVNTSDDIELMNNDNLSLSPSDQLTRL